MVEGTRNDETPCLVQTVAVGTRWSIGSESGNESFLVSTLPRKMALGCKQARLLRWGTAGGYLVVCVRARAWFLVHVHAWAKSIDTMSVVYSHLS